MSLAWYALYIKLRVNQQVGNNGVEVGGVCGWEWMTYECGG